MMTDWRERLEEEADALRRVRDELKVQAHLGAAEAKDSWQQLEERWHQLEAKLKLLGDSSKESLEDIGEAAKLLAEEIRDGYQHFKNLV